MDYQKPLQLIAYETLKSMITNGDFEIGTIYSETKISRELGISRTPLRDAIHRLAQEKYIDVLPSKGFMLHELNEKDLTETYQIRCALEGFCIVYLAREHDTLEARRVIRALESILRDQESIIGTTDSIEDFAAYDQEFHSRIVAFADNSAITSLHNTYTHQIMHQALLSLQAEGRMKETVEEHRRIIDAISSGSIDESYLAAMAHLARPKAIIESAKME